MSKQPKRNSAPSSSLGTLPVIRIKDAWLLRQHASKHLHELWNDGKEKLADDAWMERRVTEYTEVWQPYEPQILRGMTEVLGLSFRQNIIDVYIAPWFSAFSDPLVIGVTNEPDVFIDLLTHELIHRLLTDNTSVSYASTLLLEWEKLFGRQATTVQLVHIPVHAVHKAIYLDILKEPSRLQRDVKRNEEYGATDYIKAWSYVEKHGYKTIIRKLRALYKSIESQ